MHLLDTMVSSFILWLAAYALVKGVARWKWGEPSWDPVCLIHNILSVCTGAIALWHWDAENATAACGDVTSPSALVLSLQVRAPTFVCTACVHIHRYADITYYVYCPIFGIAVLTCSIQPSLPGDPLYY